MSQEDIRATLQVYDRVGDHMRSASELMAGSDLSTTRVEPELPNEYSEKHDLYAEVANKFGWTREQAKANVLASAYGLVKKTHLDQVAEFHERFGLPTRVEGQPPRELTDEESLFRIGFMLEELAEYATSSGFLELGGSLSAVHDLIKAKSPLVTSRDGPRDFHDQLDALADLSYVTNGTSLFHGFDLDGALSEVHRANMKKVRATSEDQSKRGSKLDVVKPPGWTAPDLSRFLR